ncbi:phosphotransferase [Thiomicrospira microaerophila]|uniref:aminoglycoside phosphotransferase family protein n=1 Tax=Thiomicrospira microaerophila TaxID=406020 RepID=UPI00200FE52E|nr:phosphotransferase [Thiomicrospira microaerophila]UQB41588.1 phosphotransferase [Thiomicrospira microaerophila]
MDSRFLQMQAWLANLSRFQSGELDSPVAASSDASFRRYFRVLFRDRHGEQSWIIMDAPPEKEDCLPFIQVSKQLASLGLQVPVVAEQDLLQGFLLLTDLGSTTYLAALTPANAEALYADALRVLVKLQTQADASLLPKYSPALLGQEMALFNDWLGQAHCDLVMSKLEQQAWLETQRYLIDSALAQPQVYVHRDYHSRNLMLTRENNPGILDFQDAVLGPLTYDAVSLLRDCYVDWPVEQVREWQRQYFLMLCQQGSLTKSEWTGFIQAMDWMGIQRHLKASGIFARLYHRDAKAGYLNDIPRTLNYIIQTGSGYAEMLPLVNWTEKLAFRFAEVRI